MRSHRAQIATWLRALDVTSVEQLFDALGGRDATSTALLLGEHRRGVGLATTVLLGAKAVMLSSVARHAPGDSSEERFQVTVDAFLSRALPVVKPTHKHADAQLYWITLRTVTKMHEPPVCAAEPSFEDVAGDDVHAEADTYLTADVLLDWALSRGVLAEEDHRALRIRFGGDTALPVRKVAALMGVTEDKLESRLRRALNRLREAVAADRDDLDCACIEARWSGFGGAHVPRTGAAA
jgi:hypothetical protein